MKKQDENRGEQLTKKPEEKKVKKLFNFTKTGTIIEAEDEKEAKEIYLNVKKS